MATKAEVEEQLAEAQAKIMELEAKEQEPVPEPTPRPKPALSPADAGKDAFLRELDEEQTDIWAHRFESDAFVRAFAWARKRGNETKGCLVWADAHELEYSDSDEPVVQKD
jgi:hypothetical protein